MSIHFQIDTENLDGSVFAVNYVPATNRMRTNTKVMKIKDMLMHFSSIGVEEITLADISKFMGATIRQARWCEDKDRNKLYPDNSYTSRGAPFPSTWNVQIWKDWLNG